MTKLSVEEMEYLDVIRARRFPNADRDRFIHLWIAAAKACGVSPPELRETDSMHDIRKRRSRWGISDFALQDLEALLMAESRDRAGPTRPPETIGELLDYLLADV